MPAAPLHAGTAPGAKHHPIGPAQRPGEREVAVAAPAAPGPVPALRARATIAPGPGATGPFADDFTSSPVSDLPSGPAETIS